MASPYVVELVDAAGVYDAKPTVCRNLFGPINHDLCHDFLKRQLAILMDTSSSDWDFDFATELPRQGGRFVWEAVSRQAMIPSDPDERVQSMRVLDFKNPSAGTSSCRSPKGDSNQSSCQKKRHMVQSSLKRFLPVRKHPADKLRSDTYHKLTSRSHSKDETLSYIRCHEFSCGCSKRKHKSLNGEEN